MKYKLTILGLLGASLVSGDVTNSVPPLPPGSPTSFSYIGSIAPKPEFSVDDMTWTNGPPKIVYRTPTKVIMKLQYKEDLLATNWQNVLIYPCYESTGFFQVVFEYEAQKSR